jgi:Holliday junction DNA helicase RuvA
MIGKLIGTVALDEPTSLTLDVNGVGYETACPLGTVERARRADGKVELWVHTVVRQDVFELFGFASELERRVFRQLISVPNVGPRTALAVMSALPVAELVNAVQAGDIARLVRVPGVGKKTAERLVLELRGKLPVEELAPNDVAPAAPSGRAPGDARGRLTAALTNMGYKPAEAERAVKALGKRVSDEPLSSLLRDALAELAS